MKTRFLFLVLFIASYSFSQSVNDYKAVIIPMKFDFLKEENQYRLQTLTKFNLEKAGFQAFYVNEAVATQFPDRCSLLYVDVKKDKGFLVTKLYITFKDCYGVIIFQSAIGKSREKEYGASYYEALNEAFKSVFELNYTYSEKTNSGTKPAVISESIPAATPAADAILTVSPATSEKDLSESKVAENKESHLLYAQPTSYGYQLIDSEPKVVMKVYKTSNTSSFMATKGSLQGVLVAKDNQWFFEYYQNDKLVSEKVNVKF